MPEPGSPSLSIERRLGVVLAGLFIFALVYTPHWTNPLPIHMDEWDRLAEALRLARGEYASQLTDQSGTPVGLRAGFHLFLVALSKFTDLLTVYRYLPALWAVISGLVLFHVTRQRTGRYSTALWAMLFFASLKSNVNFLGLWFFTPLTFAIPFVFLYVHLLVRGLELRDRRRLVGAAAIMALLLFTHAISVLFALPFLGIYALRHRRYLIEERRFFAPWLALPVAGALFFLATTNTQWSELALRLKDAVQFKRGWGIYEYQHSFRELYSPAGYALALIGAAGLLWRKERRGAFAAYLLWPVCLLAAIYLYRWTGVSFLSPYQRNLYYFALGLPLLSALGLSECLDALRWLVRGRWAFLQTTLAATLVAGFLVASFVGYFDLRKGVRLYHLTSAEERGALTFLAHAPKGRVLAWRELSTELYAISGQEPVATMAYGDRRAYSTLMETHDCGAKGLQLKEHEARYVASRTRIPCGWNAIYQQGIYVYDVAP